MGFRDRTPDFEAEGVEILGISYDTPSDNWTWSEAMGFRFRLLSDTDESVTAAYGAQRPPDDRYAAYPNRVTFVIDPHGRIRLAYEVAGSEIDEHASLVLEDLRALIHG